MNRLVKYLAVVLKWRKFIFWNTFILALLAVGVSFILPQRFAATAQLLPPTSDADPFGLTSILGGGMGGSALSRLRSSVLGTSASAELVMGIIESQTVLSNVAVRCSIAERYRVRRRSREGAVRKLRQLMKVSASDAGVVRIRAEAKTRALAADIANACVDELDAFLRTSNISRGRNMRLFLERRLSQVDSALSVAQDSLREFQQRHGVMALDDETKAAVESYARLKSQMLVRESEMQALAGAASASNPYYAVVSREVESFREGLRTMENGAPDGYGAGFGISFADLPGVAAEYAVRYRDFRIQEESYAVLYQQYEYARVLEARDAPAITILDRARPPERRSFPRRLQLVLAVMFFSLVYGILYALAREYMVLLGRDRPEQYAEMLALWKQSTAFLARPVRHRS